MQTPEMEPSPGTPHERKPGGQFIAAIITGCLVFLLTYASAWTNYRSVIVFGVSDSRFFGLRAISQLIAEFHRVKNRYPDSLDEVKGRNWGGDTPRDNTGRQFLEGLSDRLRYQKGDQGFALQLLERGGQTVVISLDHDLGQTPPDRIRIDRWAARFLFEGMFSGTLFMVACGASLCAALACYFSSQPRAGRHRPIRTLTLSVLTMTISAVIVSCFLILVYIGLTHH